MSQPLRLAPSIACFGILLAGFAAQPAAATASGSSYSDAAFADFQAKCASPGVLVCRGFDNASTFTYSPTATQGLDPILGTTTLGAFQDTTVKAAGNSSLRFDIKDDTGPDPAGNFVVSFGHTFSQNSTFYVQFDVRFDSNYVDTNWQTVAKSSPKLVDFYDASGSTCDHIELTTVDYYGTGMPMMYTDCGGRALTTSPSAPTSYQSISAPPFLLQQGTDSTDGYNCLFNQFAAGSGNGQGCFYYPANTWITFDYRVSVGTWGSPDSTIQAWVTRNGVKKQWINVQNYTLYPDNPAIPSEGFNHLMLTTYMTGKSTTAVYPTAHMWVDDLIVSSQPIPADPAPPVEAVH